VWLIRHLDVFVSVDSGPAHIAAAVGTPLVVLWGPGILAQTRPIAETGSVEIVREAVGCAPCYGTPMMKACRRNICMEGITPDRVLQAIARRLEEPPTVRPWLRPPA
jgi:ADP-heptose:LPS heptosyltransferase